MVNFKTINENKEWDVGDTFMSEGMIYLIGYDGGYYRCIDMSGSVSEGFGTIEELVNAWVDDTDMRVDLNCEIQVTEV